MSETPEEKAYREESAAFLDISKMPPYLATDLISQLLSAINKTFGDIQYDGTQLSNLIEYFETHLKELQEKLK